MIRSTPVSALLLLAPTLVLLAACGPEPITTPGPSVPTTSPAEATSCKTAAAQRARVPGLLAEGRLDRTVRVIERADALCPSTAQDTWAPLVTTLAELGRAADAAKLADAIDAGAPAASPARAAAKKARETLAAPDGKTPRALFTAGVAAKAAGDNPGAQRLFDRAVVALEAATGKKVTVADAPYEAPERQRTVAWSPNGDTLAIAAGRVVSIHERSLGFAETMRLEGHSADVTRVVISPDGKTLATASLDATARLWDAATGTLLRTLTGHTEAVRRVAFAPDGKTLATASNDKTVRLWNVATGETTRSYTAHQERVASLAFSPDGKLVASAGEGQQAHLWSAADGKLQQTIQIKGEILSAVTFSPDGQTLATASTDWVGETSTDSIRLWTVATGKRKLDTKGGGGGAFELSFSPDGKHLTAASRSDTWSTWSTDTGKVVHTGKSHTGWFTSAAFSPDGKLVATGGRDGTVRLRNTDPGTETQVITGRKTPPFHMSLVTFLEDGTLARTTADRVVRTWSPAAGPLTYALSTPREDDSRFALSPDGQTFASVSFANLTLHDLVDPGKKRDLADPRGQVNSITFSADGKLLATGSPGELFRLWDVAKGTQLHKLAGHTLWVKALAFSRDGKTLASGSDDKHLLFFDTATGTKRRDIPHPDAILAVTFSPDGTLVATASADNTARLWNTTTGAELHTLKAHTAPVTTVAFSEDGKTLATGSEDATVRLWSTETGTLTATLQAHTHPVSSVAFSRDGKTLATTSDEGSLHLWTPTGAPLLTLRSLPLPAEDASQIFTRAPTPLVELFGPDTPTEHPLCRAGAWTYPFALCREHVEVKGLFAKVMAGDPSYSEP